MFQVAKETSTSAILGVSCWLAPHPTSTPESWYSWAQGWALSFNQLLNNIRHWGRGGLRANRYWIWKARQQEAQSQIWDDPHGYYFCNIVAVSPTAQGRGVGRMLFEAVTRRADAEGRKCYLESSKNVPNVQIYERMGFHMSMEMECRDGDDACMVCSYLLLSLCFLSFSSDAFGTWWLTCG
jgi:GNAT superfamily N-acetyltransferase